MGKQHIYSQNTDNNITMKAAQTPTTGITTSTELTDKLNGRLLPPTYAFAADDALLLATSLDCYRDYPLEYVAVEAMTAAVASVSNQKPLSTPALASDRNCNKRNNSGRGKYSNSNKNSVNISGGGSSTCYTHGSKSRYSFGGSNKNYSLAATATIATPAKTTSCCAGESGKMLQPAQLATTTPTTITPACKISHRKNKRKHSSNATTNAIAAATTPTVLTRRTAASTTTAKISRAKVAAKLKLSPTMVAALPIAMLLQFMQLFKNAMTRPTTTATDKILSAAVRCQAAAMVSGSSTTRTRFRLLPGLGASSFFTLLTLVCLETVLLSTVSNCAKTFYMHWNTSNSIFRIDNTDHIIDVNKGNLAFEFDQVHIICPVYEPGTFENETEKYIIYNVSKVEYETCRITNADPRVIAICDKPQKLMFFTITFRPFTPQPGGLEFLPGNDYYFISTSSKDDLYRRIGGRCSTNNMKVVFKVCCASEEKNKTTSSLGSGGVAGSAAGSGSPTGSSSANNAAGATDNAVGGGGSSGLNLGNVDVLNSPTHIGQHPHMNNINTIGINGVNTGLMPIGGGVGVNGGGVGGNGGGGGGIQLKPLNGVGGTSINTNVDQFNRIPMQTNGVSVMGNNVGGMGNGIMLTPGGVGGVQHGGINLIPNGGIGQYPGQTGIRINNVASQQHHPTHKINNNNNHNGKDAVADVGVIGGAIINGISFGDGQFLPPVINTNHSNIVQSTMNWPVWVSGKNTNTNNDHYINSHVNNLTATTTTTEYSDHNNPLNINYYSPSHRPTNNKKNKNDHFDKHPNEVVKNEELTYNSGAASILPRWRLFTAHSWLTTSWLLGRVDVLNTASWKVIADVVCGTWLPNLCPSSWYQVSAYCGTRSRRSSSSSSSTCSSDSGVWIERQQLLQQHSNCRLYRLEITPSKGIVNFKYLIFSYYKVIVVSIALIIIVMKCICKSILSAVPAAYIATASSTPAASMSNTEAASQTTTTSTLLSLSSYSSSPTNTALSLTTQTERPASLDLVESEESSYLPVNYCNSKATTKYSENVKSFR